MRETVYRIDPERFKRLSKRLRLSGRSVAAAAGLSQAMVSKVARGESNVSLDSLQRIASVLAQVGGFEERELEVWLVGGAVAPVGIPPIIDR